MQSGRRCCGFLQASHPGKPIVSPLQAEHSGYAWLGFWQVVQFGRRCCGFLQVSHSGGENKPFGQAESRYKLCLKCQNFGDIHCHFERSFSADQVAKHTLDSGSL